jgi:predicted CoA-substrate-specific enzyme activase
LDGLPTTGKMENGMEVAVGIDLGSTAIKVVLVTEGKIVWKKAVPTAPGQAAIAERLTAEGLKSLGIPSRQEAATAVTGYGKGLVNGAAKVIDEVSANAFGISLLSGGRARTVINIGGQDVKVIRLSASGKLIDFKMNDKCAAGTGRFFEMAGRILDTPVDAFGAMGHTVDDPATLNSTCAVFAESEIVSLMAKGVAKERIIQGLHEAIARRIAGLAGSQDVEDDLYLDGGTANNRGLVAAVEDELFRDVYVLPHPQFTVAYGAARTLGDDMAKP